jgi:hypothetical protein
MTIRGGYQRGQRDRGHVLHFLRIETQAAPKLQMRDL